MTDPAPMTLANMRAMGVQSVSLICQCGRQSEANADRYPGHYAVIELRRFFRCSSCGKRPQASRPGMMRRSNMGMSLDRSLGEGEGFYRPGDEALLMR